jgi:diguanylate cyclase (GGDEF)-like protein
VLQEILRITVELTSGDAAAISLLTSDGQAVAPTYSANLPKIFPGILPRGQGLIWRIIDTGTPAIVEDYAEQPNAAPSIVRSGVRSVAAAPIRSHDTIIGVLIAYGMQSGRQFTSNDLQIVITIGVQAGYALRNAQLYASEQRRVQGLEALRISMAEITAELEQPKLLQAIIEHAAVLLAASDGVLALYSADTRETEVVAAYNTEQSFIGLRQKLGEGVNGYVAQSREPLLIENDRQWEHRRALFTGETPLTVLAVPLLIGDHLLGVLTLNADGRVRRFNQHDMQQLSLFAQQAAVAIRNAQLFEKVHQLATIDPLTGASNRRHFLDLAANELARADRYPAPVAALVVDIDHFKQINDTYGHTAGDQVLCALVEICHATLRTTDLLARFGGEEFVVLLPKTDAEQARQVAERLRQAISEMASERHPAGVVTVSIGLAAREPGDSSTLEALLDHADQALYMAKAAGRNCVCIWQAPAQSIPDSDQTPTQR